MKRYGTLTTTALLSAALGLVTACADDQTTSWDHVRRLHDADHDNLLEEENEGGLIMPEPGDCPIMEWREIHTVTTDAEGNILSETFTVCTQCFAEDGAAIGEETCYDEPPMPPELICEEYDSGDPTLVCYRCLTPDGELYIDECYALPVECASDADCPEGQVCYLYDTGWGMGEDRDGDGMPDQAPPDGDMPVVVGYCGFPDPCVYVDTLPSDPTGESCWQCTDPVTGEDLGAWCDIHRCNDDGTCVNPWEVCDPAGSGYCIWDDPCDPVASLPEDPTGTDCYRCIDPTTGEDWGGWCNTHECESDADCAMYGQLCNPEGLCEWVDPCVPVPFLESDPTGMDCYSCADPVTGEDWGGFCNCHTCSTNEDCTATGFGTECLDGVCAGD